MREIHEILGDLGWEILSMKEAGVDVDIVEDGTTFEENALIKARAVCKLTGQLTMADDSGLEIDYLNKEPGVYSARYMGHDTSYDIKNASLIKRLEGVEGQDRSGRFVCAIAVCFPDGREIVKRGTMEGLISKEIVGDNGFGYDPIVYLPEYGKTSAQLDPEEKNNISHRGFMQRIMIVSDSHRRHGNLAEAIYNEQPFDLLIHLGDIEGEEDIIQELAGGETIMVPGNNDFFSPLPREREIELAGKKVLLTHGHYYYVSLDLQTLREECIARGIDIVMFGHTHRPLIQIEDELTFINPGSISYPRQADKRCTYIMLEIDDNGEMSFNLKYV